MKKTNYLIFAVFLFFLLFKESAWAQLSQCDASVPYYAVNLTGQPEGKWTSPSHMRKGVCCGNTSSGDCTSFEVTLDSGAIALRFDIIAGAIPTGALFYQINCGPQVAVGQPICISGVGPHRITFCKPGNNNNTYSVTSISKPILLPADVNVRQGCNTSITALGLKEASITWNSIYPGSLGQYNNYLSCTTACSNPSFTPDDNVPDVVQYVLKGEPFADQCGNIISFQDTVTITTVKKLEGFASPQNASFCSGTTGVILTGSATGGDGNYSYTWKNNAGTVVGTGNTYSANTAGTFTLEVKDGLTSTACPAVLINVPVTVAAAPVANAGSDKLVCYENGSFNLNGSVINASGGSWIGGSGTFSPNRNSLNVTYTPTSAEKNSGSINFTLVTSGISSGCYNDTDQVVISFSQPLIVSLTNPELKCFGDEALLTSSVSGGSSPYSYSWNTSATSSSIVVEEGSYCLKVTDATGCVKNNCITLNAPDPLSLSIIKTDVTTVGGSDGTIATTPTGGTLPYTYSWNNNQSTQSVDNLSSGTYSVGITDANGCIVTSGNIIINDPTCTGISVSGMVTNVSCNGFNNGSVYAVATGGQAPYHYQWNDGLSQSTQTATGLAPGNYTVTVTDNKLCTTSGMYVVNEPAVLAYNFTKTDVTCNNGSDGTIDLTVTGGTLPYNFEWSNDKTSEDISNLSAGYYQLAVKDAKGCKLETSKPIFIDQVNTVTVNAHASCPFPGASSTQLNVSATGGNGGNYSISLDNGQTFNPAGTYEFNVAVNSSYNILAKDVNGCVNEQPFVATVNPKVEIANVDFAKCSMGNNLSLVEVKPNGGDGGAYSVSFNYGASFNIPGEYTENLEMGNSHSIIIKDNAGCISVPYTIQIPPVLVAITNATVYEGGYNINCNGFSTGNIYSSVEGGVMPYSYKWESTNAIYPASENLTEVPASVYTLTVTDSNGCVASHSITLSQPDKLTFSTDVVPATCNLSNGEVYVKATGGTAGYVYHWSLGASTPGLSNLSHGSYNVTISDANGCHDSVSINVGSIEPMEVDANIVDAHCYGDENGAIDVMVSKGSEPYSFTWNTGSNSEGINGIAAGSYTVIIQDAAGCTETLTYAVAQPEPLKLIIDRSFYTGGYNISEHQAKDGAIKVVATGGREPYNFTWSTGEIGSTPMNLTSGTYTVLCDASGCVETASVTLDEPLALEMPTGISPNGNGQNDYFVVRGLEVYPINNLKVFNRWGNVVYSRSNYMNEWNGTNNNNEPLPAGTYFVVLTINNEDMVLTGYVDLRR